MEATLNDVLDLLAEALAQRLAEKTGAASASSGKELYTVDDLAKRYSLSESTIQRWVQAGKFGEVLCFDNRGLRVTAASVQQFEREHMVIGNTERPATKAPGQRPRRTRRDPGPI